MFPGVCWACSLLQHELGKEQANYAYCLQTSLAVVIVSLVIDNDLYLSFSKRFINPGSDFVFPGLWLPGFVFVSDRWQTKPRLSMHGDLYYEVSSTLA